MKRRKNICPMRVIKLRTYPEATKLSPLIQSTLSSIRQCWIDLRIHKRQIDILNKKPGRLNRAELIDQEEIRRKADSAERDFVDVLHEMDSMDIFVFDPAAAIALIPFNMKGELAWFIYEWTERKIVGWRYHQDPLETRHDLQEALNDPQVNPVVNP